MTVLAIGPRTSNPSWSWVGLRIAEAMGRHHAIVMFDDFAHVPDADIIVVVKRRPPPGFVRDACRKSARLFFLPVDIYADPAEIEADRAMLGACDAVLVHSAVLLDRLTPLCRRVDLVEHDAKYALDALVPFRPEGFLLWIGAFQHIPYVLDWLDRHPPPLPVRLLSDPGSPSGRLAARVVAHRLGVPLKMADGKVDGWEIEPWSEAAQVRLMAGCKAAIDIKGTGFDQMTKPPTKAQQFVASGIPFGANRDHPAMAYFRGHGLEVADAGRFDRLLSPEYWARTQAIAPRLRLRLAKDEIDRTYRRLLSVGVP